MASRRRQLGLLAGADARRRHDVNYTTAYRTPDDVRERVGARRRRRRSPATTTTARSTPSSSASASTTSTAWPAPTRRAARGPRPSSGGLGRRVQRNAPTCDHGRRGCATCGFGCPLRRQAVDHAHLARRTPPSAARGSSCARAPDKVIVERRRRAGRRGRTRRRPQGHRPLARGRRRGRRAAHARAAEALRAWRTAHRQAPECSRRPSCWGVLDEDDPPLGGHDAGDPLDQFTDLDGRGYGVKYEYRRRCTRASSAVRAVATAVRTRRAGRGAVARPPWGHRARPDRGEVKVGKDGEPDRQALAARTTTGAPARAGWRPRRSCSRRWARRRSSRSHAQATSATRPGATATARASWPTCDASGWGAGQLAARRLPPASARARMGGSPDASACGPRGRDVGGARPRRLRRLRVPDRVGRQPHVASRRPRTSTRGGSPHGWARITWIRGNHPFGRGDDPRPTIDSTQRGCAE